MPYWSQFPTISRQLKQVGTMLSDRIQTDNDDIKEALDTFATNGGKMLRPAFFLLFTSLKNNNESKKAIKVAASLEILHMATLIHDDVIDDSPTRRGQVSIQARFGKDVAVYAGDLLFTTFFELLIETMPQNLLVKNARTMKAILHGELNQMDLRFDATQPLEAYFESIIGKTAALFELACYEGAYFGGCEPQTCQLAAEIGKNIGVSFQVMDDILDYDGDEKILAKPVLEDLASGVYSLPTLLAAKTDKHVQALLQKGKQLTKQDMFELQSCVKNTGALTQAKQIAATYTSSAITQINKLPNGTAKTALYKLTKQLVKRQK